MNDEENKDAAQDAADLGSLADFFAPSWARDGQESGVRLVGEGGGRGRRRDFDRDGRPSCDRDSDRGPRPPRQGDRPRRDFGDHSNRRDFGDRPDRRAARPERPAASEAPLSLRVRFLPDGRALDAIIRRIQATHKAYPFRDIVRLFQKDDASLAVRIEADKEAGPEACLYQCRLCGMPALGEAEVADHLFEQHLRDYFDAETVEGEAPAGNFPCVARCGLSGELLGPPNHHSYARRIAEMLHDRYPGMSQEEYNRHIEMVRDPEVVEKWRDEARRRTLFFRKDEASKKEEPAAPSPEGAGQPPEAAPDAPGVSAEAASGRAGIERAEAEAIFRRDIIPGQIGRAPHVVCAATVLKNMPNRRLAAYLNREFARDDQLRSQGSLSKALHAAFHHRKLHFFHANDDHGQEFVLDTPPAKLDTEHVTDELRAIVAFVAENPSRPQKDLVDAMAPGGDEEAVRRILSSVRWLIEKGHFVEYFNGCLSPAASHPVFRLAPKKERAKKAADADEAKKADASAAGEAKPAVDTPAATAPVAEAKPAVDTPAATAPFAVDALAVDAPAVDAPAADEAKPAGGEEKETPVAVEESAAAPSETE